MSTPGQGDDDLMTTDEVLTYLGFSRMTLERRMKAGRIAPVNRDAALDRPKVLRFRRADVERLKRGDRQTPDTSAN